MLLAAAPTLQNSLLCPLLQSAVFSPVSTSLLYVSLSNVVYLARRAQLRKTRKRDIFSIRISRDPDMSLAVYVICLAAWQGFVLIFPFTELIARLFGYASFMFAYPNANGFGFILEPIRVQHLPSSKRVKHQIRLDWHAFSVNRGDIGRDGYRHPPAVTCNLPHADIPKWGVKHWPWRRRHVEEARAKFKSKAKV